MESKAKRKYDKTFKENTVNLYESSGRSVKQLGEELGVPESTVSGSIEASRKHGTDAFPGKGRLRTGDAAFAQLHKELAIVREERDILKKVVGIFSSPRVKSTNL